jgi:hypothetical protein
MKPNEFFVVLEIELATMRRDLRLGGDRINGDAHSKFRFAR